MNIFQIISDILIVLIIALSLILGLRRGFVKSFFKSTKLLLVILVTFIIGSLIVTVCQDLFVGKMFEGKISEKLVAQAAQTEGEFSFEAVEKEIPTIVQNIIPMDDIEKHVSTLSGDKVEIARNTGKIIENALIDIVSGILGYALAFMLSFILCSIVIWLLDKFFELPVLKWVNRLAGFLWGVASAYLTTSLIACVIVLTFGNGFVDGTIVTKFINNIGLFSC